MTTICLSVKVRTNSLQHAGAWTFLTIRTRTGMEQRAVVEFAPFQKLPKEHAKADPRMGTIETGEHVLGGGGGGGDESVGDILLWLISFTTAN